jgi:hypothetical protein
MSKPHTLFYIATMLEIYGKEGFKQRLQLEGYTEPEIDRIRAELGKDIKSINFKKSY